MYNYIFGVIIVSLISLIVGVFLTRWIFRIDYICERLWFIEALLKDPFEKELQHFEYSNDQIEKLKKTGAAAELKKFYMNYLLQNKGHTPLSCYGLACIYAQESDNEAALFYLKLALGQGFYDLETIRKAPELTNLRQTDDYRDLIGNISFA